MFLKCLKKSLQKHDVTIPRWAAELAVNYEVAHGGKYGNLLWKRKPFEEKAGGGNQLGKTGTVEYGVLMEATRAVHAITSGPATLYYFLRGMWFCSLHCIDQVEQSKFVSIVDY